MNPNEKNTEYWSKIAMEWNEHSPHILWRKHSDAINIQLLDAWLPAGKIETVLKTDMFDEAFGDGLYPFLFSRVQQVVGIDISQTVCQTAETKYPGLKTVVDDVRCLSFANATFDLVISNSTLDHFDSIADIKAGIDELYRVLRPGGYLILTLDNLRHPIIALRHILPFSLLRFMGIVPYYVGVTLGPRGLNRVIRQAGFKVIKMGSLMHCLRVFAVPIAHLLVRGRCKWLQTYFLKGLMTFEHLSRLPTRFFTGHFIAVKAIKPSRSKWC